MVLFSPSELSVLWKTEQLFKTGSISSLPSALCSGVQSESRQVTRACTLTRVRSGGWEGESSGSLRRPLGLAPCASPPRAWLRCASQLTGGLRLCFLHTEGPWPPASHLSLAPFPHSICSLGVCASRSGSSVFQTFHYYICYGGR